MTTRPRVVVIGGGLAGMTAAVLLSEHDLGVTVLERRGSLGGRTFAMPQAAVDDVPDNGQHVLASGYTSMLAHLRRIGTEHHVVFPNRLTIRMPDGHARVIGSGPLGVARVLFGDLPGVSGMDRPRTALAQARLVWQSLVQPPWLDEVTAEEWFDRVGLPEAARRGLWNTVVIGLTGDKPDISSAKVPADLLRTGVRRAITTRRAISIGYPDVDLDTLLVDPALELLRDRGATIRTRAVVRSIEIEDGAVRGARLDDGQLVEADAIVCAVPVWQVADLLAGLHGAPDVTDVVEHLTPVPIVSVNLYLDRDIGMADWGEVLHGGEGVLEQVWDRQRMHGRSPERGWMFSTTVSAAYELTERSSDEIVEQQMAQLRRYYPAAHDAQIIHSQVVRMPQSTFAQRPGTHGVRPPQRTQVRGLVLAGDWTATEWTTTMEGACQSAELAVEELRREMAVRPRPSPGRRRRRGP